MKRTKAIQGLDFTKVRITHSLSLTHSLFSSFRNLGMEQLHNTAHAQKPNILFLSCMIGKNKQCKLLKANASANANENVGQPLVHTCHPVSDHYLFWWGGLSWACPRSTSPAWTRRLPICESRKKSNLLSRKCEQIVWLVQKQVTIRATHYGSSTKHFVPLESGSG